MRSLSVTLASLFVGGCAVAAFLMVFAAWFPYENLSSAELQKDDWLALAAPVLLLLAAATLVAVVKRRAAWAIVSFVGVAALGLVVVRFAVVELSDSSDGEVTVFAAGIGVVGAGAVITSVCEVGTRGDRV